ncbi:MAG: leucine-rich repeat protein [Gammaproteobacteria bacterium]|nr:leucine-rich repeat protein [Gammaproteobacteria bacterium]
MKRITALLLCLICLIGLIGCGMNTNKGNEGPTIFVTFDANGGRFANGNEVIDAPYTGKDTFQMPDNPIKEGYVFKGWYLTETATEEYDFKTEITESIRLYAQYDRDYNSLFVFILNEDGESYSLERGDNEELQRGLQEFDVPNKYNAKPVTRIGDFAFAHFENLERVTIPENVTSIGKGAFQSCEKLTSITLGKNVTNIGNYAFRYNTALTNISIPDSLTSIGEEVFDYCDGLTYNEYDNAKYLGNEENPYVALIKAKSTDITSCNINSNTKVIYDKAFEDCSGLTSITIPNKVVYVGEDAFIDCDGLERVDASSLEDWCKISFKDNPLSMAHHLYINNVEITELTIPSTITEIKGNVFCGCWSLTSITIPDGVTSIGESAFAGCKNITALSIPDSILTIGYNALDECYAATHKYDNAYYWGNATNPYVVLSNIKGGWNSDLTSCEIHSNTKFIYDNAFDYATKLTSITIPEGVRGIGYDAFYNCQSLASVEIPNSVTNISIGAFCSCNNLTSLTIGENVTEIKTDAFSYCGRLAKVVIPNKVTNIGSLAFRNCKGLTSITIGENVKNIGDSAFENCYKLVEVVNLSSLTIEKGKTTYGNIGYNALDIYTTADYTSKLSTDANGFILYTNENNKSLIGYTGNEAELTLPSDITSISPRTFEGYKKLDTITIGESVKIIGEDAFKGCEITHATIPAIAAASINNTLLQVVTITSGTEIGVEAFKGCTSLTTVTIADSVTSIRDHAFADCTGLKTIALPNGVTDIGEGAFKNSGLTIINLENTSVTEIGDGAFSNCDHLLTVNINSEVTKIGDYAFKDSTDLWTMTFEGTISQWNAITKGTNWASGITTTSVYCKADNASVGI